MQKNKPCNSRACESFILNGKYILHQATTNLPATFVGPDALLSDHTHCNETLEFDPDWMTVTQRRWAQHQRWPITQRCAWQTHKLVAMRLAKRNADISPTRGNPSMEISLLLLPSFRKGWAVIDAGTSD